jgi:hypothetical protein
MKYIEANVPDCLYTNVVYLHEGIVSKNKLKKIGHTNTKYVTICKLIDKISGEVMAQGQASCSPCESPTRSVGRAVAVGRALAQYMEPAA